MTDKEWLERAHTFELGNCKYYNRPVFIQARDQADGSRLWVLQLHQTQVWVLGKDGEFHYEPMPSSRTEEFIALTRFSTPQEVYDFWIKSVTEAKPLYVY